MVNSRLLQVKYNQLYTNFRQYIWDSETVSCLADLEINIYKLCPNLDNVRHCLDKLVYRINLVDIEDEDLYDSIDQIYDYIDNEEDSFCSLELVNAI